MAAMVALTALLACLRDPDHPPMPNEGRLADRAWFRGGSVARTVSDGWPTGSETRFFEWADFDRLASFAMPPRHVIEQEAGDDQALATRVNSAIPSSLRELNNRPVVLTGFMLPLRMDEGRCVEFLLVRSQAMCCFGQVPELNEWVHVTAAPEGLRAQLDVPLRVSGTLRVGALFESGFCSSIYRMDDGRLHPSDVP
jgi:hypothetical protein